VDKGFFRFFNDFSNMLCGLVTEGSYINYSDKKPEEVKPKDEGFDKTAEKIVDITKTASGTGGLDISFGNIFQVKYKIIMIVIIIIAVAITAIILIIFLYCYNKTEFVITMVSVSSI
jgi:hypothetical protein